MLTGCAVDDAVELHGPYLTLQRSNFSISGSIPVRAQGRVGGVPGIPAGDTWLGLSLAAVVGDVKGEDAS